MPTHRFGITFTRGAFRGGHLGELKPRMIAKELDDTLPYQAGSASHSSTPFFVQRLHGTASRQAFVRGGLPQWHRALRFLLRTSEAHVSAPNFAGAFWMRG